jgi:hypothetical protein
MPQLVEISIRRNYRYTKCKKIYAVNRPTINSQTFGKIYRSPWITLAILSCVGLISMLADTMMLPAIHDFIK